MLLMYREEIVESLKVEDISDHKIIAFKVLRKERKESNETKTLDFKKADFNKRRVL